MSSIGTYSKLGDAVDKETNKRGRQLNDEKSKENAVKHAILSFAQINIYQCQIKKIISQHRSQADNKSHIEIAIENRGDDGNDN